MKLITGSLLFGLLLFSTQIYAQQPAVPEYRLFEDIHPLLSRNNDTTYVINFWATWCKPCVRELPLFEQLYDKYADLPVKILLVSLDMRKDLETRLPRFLLEQGIRCEVLALTDTDHNAWIPRVDPDWSGAIPATLIRKGRSMTFVEDEFDDLDQLIRLVESIRQ